MTPAINAAKQARVNYTIHEYEHEEYEYECEEYE